MYGMALNPKISLRELADVTGGLCLAVSITTCEISTAHRGARVQGNEGYIQSDRCAIVCPTICPYPDRVLDYLKTRFKNTYRSIGDRVGSRNRQGPIGY